MTHDNRLHEVIQQFHDSLAETDLDRVLGIYTTDSLIVSSSGDYYYGEERPERGRANPTLFWGDFIRTPSKKAVLGTIELQVHMQIAYELCSYHLAYGGGETEEGTYLAIWKRYDGNWKIGLQTFSSSDTPLTGLR